MNTFVSAIMGIAFAVVGTASVFLMFHLWGYPFDKATRTSAAPRWLMLLHRGLGFVFAALYVVMMVQMVPRLLSYQVEFPPRTVAHICLAVTIGFLLLIKISIIRFFRHLEEWMPYLGTGILLCTYLLLALSVPFAFRERALRSKALGGDVATPANVERLRRVLPDAGLPKEANIDDLVTPGSLARGRDVLLTKCVQCHDLRTVLARPRGPRDWVSTVQRMADRPLYGDMIDEPQQWQVATYLVAISPELQQAAKRARDQKERAKDARVAAVAAMESPVDSAFDDAKAKTIFEAKCTQCHDLSDVEKHTWTGADDVKDVVERMADNGLEASPDELELLRQYLVLHYVHRDTPPDVRTPATPASGAAAPSTATTRTAAPSPRPARSATPATATATTAATTAQAASAGSAAPGPGEATCGKKPLPDCPMQAWMKVNAAGVAAPSSVASVLDRIARMAPPAYGGWAQIATEGATAARSGDVKGARQSCSSCHNQFRTRYKNEMRAAPIR